MFNQELLAQGKLAKKAARTLATLATARKNGALEAMADALEKEETPILGANEQDLMQAQKRGMGSALLDRLTLTSSRIKEMADGLRALVALEDPVGQVERIWQGAQNLQIGRMRVPLGVIGIIYEARPNVTADAAGLCLKAGNAVILKGGSDALHSNKAIIDVLSQAIAQVGLPAGSVQLIANTDREITEQFMKMNEYLDVLIPRGGAGLIRTVLERATVPVIQTGMGNCHLYVDEAANLEMAKEIVLNAKIQRPGVCNALETLLVHEKIAPDFLSLVAPELSRAGVELRGDTFTRELVPQAHPAREIDYQTEFLDLILAVKTVKDLTDAIEHIHLYGTQHSEAIVTENYHRAMTFLHTVDAAAVYVNASTRFTDGFQFGYGAEIGISTQKLHARGPMGLRELTTIKHIIFGAGQVRK